MEIKNLLNNLQKLIINDGFKVSDIEYTNNNYDEQGNIIKNPIPNITTDYCEIGLYENIIYFVFIIRSKSFNNLFFKEISKFPNISMYGFRKFKDTLYPKINFNYFDFIKVIKKEEYLQIEFDFQNISVFDLYNKYLNLISIFLQDKIEIVNQLKINLKNI